MSNGIHTVIWFANTENSGPMKVTVEGYSDGEINIIASELWDRLQYCGFHMRSLRPLKKD